MTAVEWLFDKLKSHFEHDGDLFESVVMTYSIAKQMEKEQVELRYKDGTPMRKYNSPKLQAIEMEEEPKQEIIEEAALRLFPKFISDPYNPSEDLNKYERDIWIEGAKWYREQLKQKL